MLGSDADLGESLAVTSGDGPWDCDDPDAIKAELYVLFGHGG